MVINYVFQAKEKRSSPLQVLKKHIARNTNFDTHKRIFQMRAIMKVAYN